jgi:hypothetical protein
MAAKLKRVELDREQITQKQLEEVEWLREGNPRVEGAAGGDGQEVGAGFHRPVRI